MRFLHPYITGPITAKTDPKDRKSMIEQLMVKMDVVPAEKEIIEQAAFDIYLEKAILGFYVVMQESVNFKPGSETFYECIGGIKQSLPREFPDLKIAEEEFKQRVSTALDRVNKERTALKTEIRAKSASHEKSEQARAEVERTKKWEKLQKLTGEEGWFLPPENEAGKSKKTDV